MKRILVIAASFLLCSASVSFAQKRPLVVTTIGQITDATRILAGDLIEVSGLMGPGVDPHLYKASESDVRRLSRADLILYNGLYLEAKMESIFKKMSRNRATAAVGEAVPIENRLESISYSGHYDPHIWFDVQIWSHAVGAIRDALVKLDPAHRAEYEERAEVYLQKLIALDRYVRKRAAELPAEQRVLVTAHDAFRYFGRAYGFEVVGLQGISTQAEAGTADVARLAEFIARRQIKAVFIESSVPERNIRAVQDAVRARGWDVKIGGELFSDAMGSEGTLEGTYIGMVTHNIDTIVEALR